MQGAERVCEGDKVDGQKNWKSFHRPVKKPRGNVENPVERVESLFVSSPDGTKELLFWRLGGFIVAQRYPTGLAVLNKIQYNEVFKQE